MKMIHFSKSIWRIILVLVLFVACKKQNRRLVQNNTPEALGVFKAFPPGTRLDIDTMVAKNISTLITKLDAGFFFKGRDVADAREPDIVEKTLKAAAANGGTGEGLTGFDKFFKDPVTISMHTEYNIDSLVGIGMQGIDIINRFTILEGGKKCQKR